MAKNSASTSKLDRQFSLFLHQFDKLLSRRNASERNAPALRRIAVSRRRKRS